MNVDTVRYLISTVRQEATNNNVTGARIQERTMFRSVLYAIANKDVSSLSEASVICEEALRVDEIDFPRFSS